MGRERQNLVGRALGSGQPCRDTEGGAGRALSAEEDALVLREARSATDKETLAPHRQKQQEGQSRGHTRPGGKRREDAGRGGFWGGKEASGEGERDPGTGSGRSQRNWREGRRGGRKQSARRRKTTQNYLIK